MVGLEYTVVKKRHTTQRLTFPWLNCNNSLLTGCYYISVYCIAGNFKVFIFIYVYPSRRQNFGIKYNEVFQILRSQMSQQCLIYMASYVYSKTKEKELCISITGKICMELSKLKLEH